MASLAPVTGVALRGIAAGLPLNRESTLACPAFQSPDDAKRFANATGITERRIAVHGQCASDLCGFAAEALLDKLGWERADIGLLIMVSQSPDYGIPATAILLQHRLGLSTNTIAFDINLGCSAFPFGLAQAAATMRTFGIRRGLLLIGDVSSRGCNPADPSSYPLFGDAGTAIALELDDAAGAMHFDLHSDGSGGPAICTRSYGLGGRHPITAASLEVRPSSEDGHPRSDLNTRLNGADIFSFSIKRAPASIRAVLDVAGLQPADIDHLVLHQANKMINDTVCRKAGFAGAAVLSSLERLGNTASCSIPVTLCAAADVVRRPARLLACGFGVGLSWGSVILELGADLPLLVTETDAIYRPELLFDFGGEA